MNRTRIVNDANDEDIWVCDACLEKRLDSADYDVIDKDNDDNGDGCHDCDTQNFGEASHDDDGDDHCDGCGQPTDHCECGDVDGAGDDIDPDTDDVDPDDGDVVDAEDANELEVLTFGDNLTITIKSGDADLRFIASEEIQKAVDELSLDYPLPGYREEDSK